MMMAMTTASATATRGDFRVPECLGQKWWEAEVVEATWIGRSREEVKRGEPRLKEGRKVVKMRNSRLLWPRSFQRTGQPFGPGLSDTPGLKGTALPLQELRILGI